MKNPLKEKKERRETAKEKAFDASVACGDAECGGSSNNIGAVKIDAPEGEHNTPSETKTAAATREKEMPVGEKEKEKAVRREKSAEKSADRKSVSKPLKEKTAEPMPTISEDAKPQRTSGPDESPAPTPAEVSEHSTVVADEGATETNAASLSDGPPSCGLEIGVVSPVDIERARRAIAGRDRPLFADACASGAAVKTPFSCAASTSLSSAEVPTHSETEVPSTSNVEAATGAASASPSRQ